MSQEHYEAEKVLNNQAYLRLKEAGELPDGRYVTIVQGELITSGDDREEVLRETNCLMSERSIQGDSVLIQDRESENRVLHFRSPRIART